MKFMSLFFIALTLTACQSSPKKSARNPLEGQRVDALCSIEGIPVAESEAIFIKSQNGYYLLKTEDGLLVTLPVNSCVLQFQGPFKVPVKPSGSTNFPI